MAWKKESDLPPDVLEQFQRIWDKTAPERCRECGKAAAPGRQHPVRRLGKAFCSKSCATAGRMTACRKCGERASMEQPHCIPCGWGSSSTDTPHDRRGQKRGKLNDMIDRLEESLVRHLQTNFCNTRLDTNHEPAWKQRCRS